MCKQGEIKIVYSVFSGFFQKYLLHILCIYFCILAINSRAQESKKFYSTDYLSLNEWYFTTSDSVKLYVLEYGSGPDTVFVLHGGFGAEHSYLIDAFDGIYDKCHFVFYDQRGSLRSPCPLEKISINKHISDLDELRRNYGLKKINIFGHSNGSTLATFYLKQHPDNVKGLIMTACMQIQSPIKDSLLKTQETTSYLEFDKFVKRPQVQALISRIENDSSIPFSKKKTYIEKINMAKFYIYDIDLWSNGKESFGVFMNYKAGNATTKSIPKGAYDNTELYNSHPYKIFIIMGEYDMIDPTGIKFNYLTKNIKNVEYRLIGKAAHDVWVDKKEEFQKVFIKALDNY